MKEKISVVPGFAEDLNEAEKAALRYVEARKEARRIRNMSRRARRALKQSMEEGDEITVNVGNDREVTLVKVDGRINVVHDDPELPNPF